MKEDVAMNMQEFKKHYFNKMITGGLLKRTIPDKPSSPKQQYYS